MEVRHDDTYGRCAVAATDLDKGTRFLEERATLYWETAAGGRDELESILAAYTNASAAARSRVDDLTSQIQTHSPELDSLVSSWKTQFEHSEYKNALRECDDAVDILLKAHFNAHAVQSPDGACLFPKGAMLNHSCAPNSLYRCEAHTIQFFSNSTIPKGEELTAAYLDAVSMIKPTKYRQQVLLLSKGFLCACPRCSADSVDNTRPSRCPRGDCQGIVFAHNRGLKASDGVEIAFSSCGVCDSSFTRAHREQIEHIEEELYRHWEVLDSRLGRGSSLSFKEINESIKTSKKKLHSDHFITNLYRVLAIELGSSRTEDKLLVTLHAFKYVDWLYRSFDTQPANLLGTMTGAIAELFDRHTSTIIGGIDVDRVLTIMKNVLPYAEIRYGSKAAYPKALAAVLRKYASCSSLICTNTGKLMSCGRCNSVAYCSRSCQVFHFKSQGHKAECAAIVEARNSIAALDS